MLILSRKVGESITIDDNVEVVVLRSSRGRVQIGLRAPSDVRVVRSELVSQRTKKSLEVCDE
jgi:carbon storage regulator